jgi:hypothetical protein
VFPLHNSELKDALWAKWMPFKKPTGGDWAGLPIEDIKDYFGEEVLCRRSRCFLLPRALFAFAKRKRLPRF